MQAYQRNAQAPKKRFFERRHFLIGLLGLGTLASLGGAGALAVLLNDIRVKNSYLQPSTIYHGHSTEVAGITWSPDGKRLASLSKDGKMNIWEHHMGKTLFSQQIRKKVDDIRSPVVWSPNGKYIAVTGDNAKIYIWNTATNSIDLTYQGHAGAYGMDILTWSPNSELIASRDIHGTLHVWNPVTGKHVSTINGDGTYLPDIAWSPDSKLIATNRVTSHEILIWNIATNSTVLTLPDASTSNALRMTWIHDSKRMITINSDTGGSGGGGLLQVCAYDTKTGKEILTFSVWDDSGLHNAWTWSANDEAIIFTDATRLKIWDTKKGGPVRYSSLSLVGNLYNMSFSADGRYLAGGADTEIWIWDISSVTFVESPKA